MVFLGDGARGNVRSRSVGRQVVETSTLTCLTRASRIGDTFHGGLES
jgi:hypothetical protein